MGDLWNANFNDTSDKFFTRTDEQIPIIHNNMSGRIVDFESVNVGKVGKDIQFDLQCKRGCCVIERTRNLYDERGVTYMPIYFIIFFKKGDSFGKEI